MLILKFAARQHLCLKTSPFDTLFTLDLLPCALQLLEPWDLYPLSWIYSPLWSFPLCAEVYLSLLKTIKHFLLIEPPFHPATLSFLFLIFLLLYLSPSSPKSIQPFLLQVHTICFLIPIV